jgi:hypothetical protein
LQIPQSVSQSTQVHARFLRFADFDAFEIAQPNLCVFAGRPFRKSLLPKLP